MTQRVMNDVDKWNLLQTRATDKRSMSTKRTMDVIISDTMGELATKTVLYKHNKAVSTLFVFTRRGEALVQAMHRPDCAWCGPVCSGSCTGAYNLGGLS